MAKAEREHLASLLKGISNHVLALGRGDGAGYRTGFERLKSIGINNTCSAALNKKNHAKNRYRNIPAYDHTRVLLKAKNVEGTDYINANWIDGFEQPKKYIATQGPVPTSILDFWAMVWDQEVHLIVKVTREVENGVLKCHRYWPDPDSEPPQKMVLMGQVEVEHVSTVACSAWITRKFKIRKGTEERTLSQTSYEAWPDHGVPITSREFLSFRSNVHKLYEDEGRKGPILTHCSAGVGRTGTYITVDRVLDAVDSGKKSKDLDLEAIMAQQRNQRVFMVQTAVQFEFAYKAVADGIRMKLNKAGGMTLSRKMQEFLDEDTRAAKELQRIEDQETAELLKNQRAALKATTMTEINEAVADTENYDVMKNLTNLESRVTSLLQVGSRLDMTPATSDQIREIVRRSKMLEQQQKVRRIAARDAVAQAQLEYQEEQELKAMQTAQKTELTKAERERAKFMKKMGAKKK